MSRCFWSAVFSVGVTLTPEERQRAVEYYMDSTGAKVEENAQERFYRSNWADITTVVRKALEFPDDEDAAAFLAALREAVK